MFPKYRKYPNLAHYQICQARVSSVNNTRQIIPINSMLKILLKLSQNQIEDLVPIKEKSTFITWCST